MLSALMLCRAVLYSFASAMMTPRAAVPLRAIVPLRIVASICLLTLILLLPLASVSAQGSFTTNKPFLVSIDKTRHFTLAGIPVVYHPVGGSAVAGFLTLSGTPDNRLLTLFSDVQLSFSPTAGGAVTIRDSFRYTTVVSLSANLYCLASVGTSRNGNSFNLYGGFLGGSAAASPMSTVAPMPTASTITAHSKARR